MDCGIPYCHNGCPVNNQIPDWNDLVYKRPVEDGGANLHSTNNFPEVTGRVCPAPCEAPARSTSTTTRSPSRPSSAPSPTRLSRKAGSRREPPERKTGKTVAIVGSGPAGLAAAQQLARAGHEVHVYEKSAKPGGLLRLRHPRLQDGKAHRRAPREADGGGRRHLPLQRARRQDVTAEELEAKHDARAAGRRLRAAVRLLRQVAGARPRRHPLRHGLPAAAEPARRRRAARQRGRDQRQGQARHRHRRRRHGQRLHRHVVPAGRQVGDAARDHADAAGEGEQGAVLAALAAEAARLLQPG